MSETIVITKEQMDRARMEPVVVVEAPGHGKVIIPSRVEPTADGGVVLLFDVCDAGFPEGTLATVTATLSYDIEAVESASS
jgi:hypothetical protein